MRGDWQETTEIDRFGIAIHNFHEDGKHRLWLDVGDSVNTISHAGGWFYGFCTKDRSKKGIFPKSYVFLKESIADVQGVHHPKDLPIVKEITAVLREWGNLWKRLYLNLLGDDKLETELLKKTMLELIDFRRLIMSRKLTVDEMREVQQKVTQRIDAGNARLGLDLVIRDEHGNIVDPLKTSTISLFRMHQQATKRIHEENDLSTDKSMQKKAYSFNLYVNVKNFVCRIGENANILLTLYDAKEGVFISENYIMKWGDQGLPKDFEMLNNLRVIFMDLSEKDVLREKIFLVCQIIRIGRMDLKESDSKKLAKGMKRPFGVACIDVGDILRGRSDSDDEKQYFIPFMQCGEHDSMDVVIKKSIMARDINHKGQGLWVTMRNLIGDLAVLQKDYPHLVTNTTSIARKMGFPDVIMPGDVRNDLYVTIKQGEFRRGGNKMADKNIEVTLTICNGQGEVINKVISEGAGGEMVSHYKTIIYYHEDRPKWFETVKVAIPINESSGVHLKFTVKHRSTSEAKDRMEKPFAMSYIRLMNDDGTTLSDTDHDLLVYKLDAKKLDEPSVVYFKLPSTQKDLQRISQSGQSLKSSGVSGGSISLSVNDVFQVSTLICSTKLTHNVELMGLLKWRENPSDLKDLLKSFMNVDGEEIVKFLQDTLDALFNILIENSDSDLYDKLVFDALVFLLGIVSDPKYNQFKPVLDVYIQDSFSATLVYSKLMVVLKSYIEDVSTAEKANPVIKAMKCLDYIFKFIVHSRLLFSSLNENGGKQQFEVLLCQLFTSMNNFMKDGRSIKLAVSDCILNILPSIISDVLLVYSPIDFSGILIECINSIPAGKLVIRRLHCINSLVHTQLFKIPDCRRILLPVMLDHVYDLMSGHLEMMNRHHYRDSDPDTTLYNELDICIKILSDVMDYEFKNMSTGTLTEDMTIISLKMLRLVTQTVIYLDKQSSLIGNCVAVMTAILRQMSDYHYNQYITRFETPFDLHDYLMEILMIFEELVTRNVYPCDWNEMILLQNWVFLTTLKYFSNTVRDKFTTPFGCDLWQRYFLSSIAFIVQKPLQLEEFSLPKRIKITSLYKDMRIEASLEIRSMWNNLGQHKLMFIPEIVGPFLKMTLVPEKELREKTIPIFFDMMQAEFMSTSSKLNKKNFSKFEHELIARIDEFVKENQGDESYQEMFYEIIRERCENHKSMRENGLTFVETIKDLFILLLQYRAVSKDDSRDNKMSCLVNLLNFYHDIRRDELFIRCLKTLCDLHLDCDNFTEAGYTIMLYSKMLRWTNDPLPPLLFSEEFPKLNTHRKLKENLYYQIISHFDKGKMWEKGIDMCKELAQQYESETFDYLQLSEILKKQAELYDSIMKKIRPEPEYFRVGYYGLGFPPFLQNRTFVYRGKEFEKLSDFVSRLLNQYPNAQLIKTLNLPDESIKQQQTQYLQINKVTPMLELKENLSGKRLSEQILRYFKMNEVQKFSYSRKKDESTNELASMWLERTILVTSYPLPGILQWFPVTSTQTFDVSPLQLAIETIEDTNLRLNSLIEQQAADLSSKINQLGMVLQGVLDAAVNGGIANYKIFYSEEYLVDHMSQEERDFIAQLRQCTTKQMVILRTALNIHKDKVPENLKPFHEHLEKRYVEMKKTLEKEYGIKAKEEENYEEADYVSSANIRRMQNDALHRSDDKNSPSRSNIPLRGPCSSLLRSDQLSSPSLSSLEYGSSGKHSSIRSSLNYADCSPKRLSGSPRLSTASSGIRATEMLSSNSDFPGLIIAPRAQRPDSSLSVNFRPNQRKSNASIGALLLPDGEEPPPLPEKTSHADYANVEGDAKPHSESALVRKGTHKDRPQLPLPTTPNQVLLPPKKAVQEFDFGSSNDADNSDACCVAKSDDVQESSVESN